MSGLIGGSKTLRVKEFRSSGNFTVPHGIKTVSLFMVGGGGGGASGHTGQGGNVVEVNYDVDGKASCNVIVGAGGVGATSGGDTSFDGVAIAKGGSPYGVTLSGTVVPQIGSAGKNGFGGPGGNGTYSVAGNGALGNGAGAENTGAGSASNGGSGYLRVEWYE